MTEATGTVPESTREQAPRSLRGLLQALNLDTRLLGMVGALAVIWIGFQILSGLTGPKHDIFSGTFLTPVNLYNLAQQSVSVGIMATGMVLIIVSRNIDLSIGSILGLTGYTMAMVQVIWIPKSLGLGFDQPYTWIIALAIGIALGAAIGAFQGFLIAYGKVPAFIVTLGGLLVWRGLVFEEQQGQTISPLDKTFQLLGGSPTASLGDVASWILGILACAGIVYTLIATRRKRRKYGFPVRPTWALGVLMALGCLAILGFVWIMNSYAWPPGLATQYAHDHGITAPPGGLQIATGIAFPVIILIAVTLVMTYITTRRRFGRYVFAIGGNPDAAELGGINVRRTIMLTFVLIGVLAAISGAVQSARLQAAVTSLGTQAELDVIAAAVIGGTSFSGGIGTIPGAVLGAVVMQSLRSGMLLLRVDSPIQDIVVGVVLVSAIAFDTYVRGRSAR
jgi:D-xylose transport system permease protein